MKRGLALVPYGTALRLVAGVLLGLGVLVAWLYRLSQMPPTFPAGVDLRRYQ